MAAGFRPSATPRQRATKRSEAGLSRAASLVNRSAAACARPVARAAASPGSPGSSKRNLRHSCTSRKRAANAASSSSLRVAARRGPARPATSGQAAYDVARPARSQAPTGSGVELDRDARAGRVPPARATTSSTSAPLERAQPHAGRVLGVPEVGQLLRAAGPRAPRSRGRSTNDQPPAPVPRLGCRCGRSGRPPRSSRSMARGGRAVAAARRRRRAGSSQPCADHPRDRGPDRGSGDADRLEQPDQGRDRGLVAARAQVVAVHVEQGRAGVHAVTVPGPACRGRTGRHRAAHRG